MATVPALPAVGIVGTGSMGRPVALRVLAGGYPLRVHDARPEAVQELACLGATVCPDPQALGEGCDVVLLSLPSHVEVEQVCFGERGVLRSLRRGGVLVNLTTGSVKQLPRLAQAEHIHGIHYVTAPVSQGVDSAALGRLSTFVGATEQGYQLALPVLATFCNNIIYLRDHVAAMAAKLVTNLSWYVNAALLPELLALSVRAGIRPEEVQAVLSNSCGDSWVVRHDVPSVLQGTYDPTFTLALAVKDLRLIGELSELLDIPIEVGAVAQTVFRRAHLLYGPDAPELSPARFIEQLTGVQLRCKSALPDMLAGTVATPPAAEVPPLGDPGVHEGRTHRPRSPSTPATGSAHV
jgi:3-hydroxyisobutyrate dehydrogenase-like beta-hydroxyacid dehydrogenase